MSLRLPLGMCLPRVNIHHNQKVRVEIPIKSHKSFRHVSYQYTVLDSVTLLIGTCYA